MNLRPLGYEQYHGRPSCVGSSLVVALTSADGWPTVVDGLVRLPHLGVSRTVSCTNSCTNTVANLLVSALTCVDGEANQAVSLLS